MLRDTFEFFTTLLDEDLEQRRIVLEREVQILSAFRDAVDEIDDMSAEIRNLQAIVANLTRLVVKATTKGDKDEEPHSDGTDTSSDHPGSL